MEGETLVRLGLAVKDAREDKSLRLQNPVVILKAIITDDPLAVCTSGDLLQLQRLIATGFRLDGRQKDVFILKELVGQQLILHPDYFRCLLQLGLNFGTRIPHSYSVLEKPVLLSLFKYTMLFGLTEFAQELLNLGTNLNLEEDIAAWLVLHRACCAEKLLPLLIERHHVDLNAPFVACTALGKAIEERKEGLVRLLLKHGANPNKRSNHKHPLKIAVKLGELTLVSILKEAGAECSQRRLSRNSANFVVKNYLQEPLVG